MKYIFTCFFFTIMWFKISLACPDLNAQADDVLKVPSDMLEGNGLSKNVYSKDEWNIVECSYAKNNVSLHNQYGNIYFPHKPNIQIDISYLGGIYLSFESNGDCDSYLLVKGPLGGWDLGNRDFPASFSNPQDGVYSIWVGTRGVKNCKISVISKAQYN